MKTTLRTDITVGDICEGFLYNEYEGKGFSNGLWNKGSGVAQAVADGRRVYKRLFIRHKRALAQA